MLKYMCSVLGSYFQPVLKTSIIGDSGTSFGAARLCFCYYLILLLLIYPFIARTSQFQLFLQLVVSVCFLALKATPY